MESCCTLGQSLVFIFLCEQDYILQSLQCGIMLHMYLTNEVYFLFQHFFIHMSAFDILRGEGKVTKGKTYDCTLDYPILYLESEFKRRVK